MENFKRYMIEYKVVMLGRYLAHMKQSHFLLNYQIHALFDYFYLPSSNDFPICSSISHSSNRNCKLSEMATIRILEQIVCSIIIYSYTFTLSRTLEELNMIIFTFVSGIV